MTTFTSRNRLLTRAGIAAAFARLHVPGRATAPLPSRPSEVGQRSASPISICPRPPAHRRCTTRIKGAARRVCGPADRYTYLTAEQWVPQVL